ncbi:MFS transporter [Viridibacillus arvi]|uniref:MFS transporter n=1 Tax=Viridibacillus arvi TaxID=263475 RepID=UPI00187BB253|nr:MFS transporter [Viridibacillus sp. JNUCC-6]QOV12006.1 MFS transporter [Viridibacillus sp. JNUCC-6]
MNRITIYLLALGAFLTGTAEFVVSGVLELIAVDLNVSISVAGQLLTFYSLSYAFGALVLVITTAKFERKTILLLSMLVFLGGNVLAFASTGYWTLMASRIVLAMSGGLYIVIATNYAAHLAEPGKKGSAMATVLTGFTVSLVLGVPIGTFIATYIDWRYIYLILAISALLNFLLLKRLIPKWQGNRSLPVKRQLLILRDKRLVAGLFTTIFWILGYTMVFAYIAPFLSELAGFSIEKISTALFILGMFAFIGSRFGGYAADKWGPAKTITFSLAIHAATLFTVVFTANSTIGVLVTLMVWGAATWTTTPANQYYLISLQPEASEIVLSFHTALMNIGMTLGAGLGGTVIAYTSVVHLGWIGGLMVLVALLAASVSLNWKKQGNAEENH